MKLNSPRRPLVHDLVDCIPSAPTEKDVVDVPIQKIVPYHNHPFTLYTGDRLTDMVESIRTHGILTPCIVLELPNGRYEMLAGHNRMNAASIAGLTCIPAVVKRNLSEDDAWTYVVETNFRQRSFGELRPSEQAAILSLQYSKMCNQGKRSDIQRELDNLENRDVSQEKGKNSRKDLAEEYHLSGSTVARMLRINYLIQEFKSQLDEGKLKITVGVEISFLSSVEQSWLLEYLQAYTFKLDLKTATALHERSRKGGLSKKILWEFLTAIDKQKTQRPYQTLKVSKSLYHKYLSNTPTSEVENIMAKALELYFASLKSSS